MEQGGLDARFTVSGYRQPQHKQPCKETAWMEPLLAALRRAGIPG